jgi:putative transposase
MQSPGRRYVRYFNYAYRRTGTLWEGRFRSCAVDADNYLLTCQRYIELNPVRARMVTRPDEYHWSSYHANANGVASRLVTPHPLYLALADSSVERQRAYRELFAAHFDPSDLKSIREVTNRGLVLGNERFVAQVEALTGRRVRPLKRGPRPKNKVGGL